MKTDTIYLERELTNRDNCVPNNLQQNNYDYLQLGKSYNMVNGYVQNRQQPRIEVLYEIAEILGVSVKELLIDNETKKDK